MKKTLIAYGVLVLALVFAQPAGAGGGKLGEYEIKSGMLYNFTYFVEWPSDLLARTKTLNVCIAGEAPSNRAFSRLHGKPYRDRTINVRHISDPGGGAGCNVLFLNRSENHNLPAYLQMAHKRSILTVSDIDNFASRGGIIGFFELEGKVRFEVNLVAAAQARIEISSQLLKLARIVAGRKP